MKTPHKLIDDTAKLLKESHLKISLIYQSGNQAKIKALDKALKNLASAADRLTTALVFGDQVPVPNTAKRVASLTDSLERIAKAARPRIIPIDTLHSLIVEAADDDIKAHWHSEPDELAVGFIRAHDDLVDDLRRRGVLVWHGDDRLTRLIDVNWLPDAEIADYVSAEAPTGNACRFCGIVEPAESSDLVSVDPEGRDTSRCHQQCIEHWQRWQDIAARFENLAEAI